MKHAILILLGLCLLPASVPAQFLFRDVTDSAGIYMYGSGSDQAGSGVVVADFNNDGWDDFYLPGGQDADKIFINMHDGTFKDVTPLNVKTHEQRNDTTTRFRTNPRGGIVLDYDNDGLPDLYVVTENEDMLWHNDGNFKFSDATESAHLQNSLNQNESMSATFGDFNGDGYNDIYVGRWYNGSCAFVVDTGLVSKPMCDGFLNWFYVNNHDGTFTDRAKEYHVDCDTTKVTNIVVFFDYDRDGDLDLLIGNDNGVWMQPNRVFRNMLMETGSAVFQDATMETGLACRMSCMGIAPCDYNRDGNFDFYETSFGSDSIMTNNGSCYFTNAAKSVLPPRNGFETNGPFILTGWTTLMGDFDNDGWEDAFLVHGSLEPEIQIALGEVTDSNKIDTSFFYRNVDGHFYDVTDRALGGKYLYTKGRGAGLLDYNNDGKLDIVYGSLSTRPDPLHKASSFRLLENISTPAESTPHWLEMRFTATRTAKEAIGTIVDVWAGGIVHSRQVSTGGGFGSQNSLMQHVGLGAYSKADSIVVFWPCDKYTHRQIDRYWNVKADTILHYVEQPSSGVSAETSSRNVPLKLYPFPATTILNVVSSSSPEAKHFEIYDLLGREQMNVWSSDDTYRMPIAGLRPGNYLLRVTIDGIMQTQRFIKE